MEAEGTVESKSQTRTSAADQGDEESPDRAEAPVGGRDCQGGAGLLARPDDRLEGLRGGGEAEGGAEAGRQAPVPEGSADTDGGQQQHQQAEEAGGSRLGAAAGLAPDTAPGECQQGYGAETTTIEVS